MNTTRVPSTLSLAAATSANIGQSPAATLQLEHEFVNGTSQGESTPTSASPMLPRPSAPTDGEGFGPCTAHQPGNFSEAPAT